MQKRQTHLYHLFIYYFDLFDIPDDILEICVASLLKKELWENTRIPNLYIGSQSLSVYIKKTCSFREGICKCKLYSA